MERGPIGELLIPLPDLEGRLAVENCLDIFTMKPRVNCKSSFVFSHRVDL